MTEKKCPISFNSIANVISIVSGVSLAGIIGVGSYVYVNRDAIIDDIKEQAIESVMGGLGGGLGGDALPVGAPDLAPPADQAAATPPVDPSGGFGLGN
tara:strand:+ start:180 stop:473 length:294 start_codon:yes stop_codon:yes gene_type:complete